MIIIKVKVKKWSKLVKGIIIPLCTILVIYLGISIYFSNHFYLGSRINGINASGKTVEKVEQEIAASIDTYALELIQRDGVKEEIKAVDIGLKYNSEGKSQDLKDSQNGFGWFFALFKKEDSQINEIISYDEELLKEVFNNLACLDSSKVIEPKNATLEYTNNTFEIHEEVYGNKLNKDILYDNVVNTILKDEKTINLEEINSYEMPTYTKDSKEVIEAKDTLNKYLTSEITYIIAGASEFLDSSTIYKWLGVDENFEIIIDENKIGNYVDTLRSKYNTAGRARPFVTSLKVSTKVSGGDYGWIIDKKKEVQDILESIKGGQPITKEPNYSSKTIAYNTNDIGNTYIEINFTKQHLWFYKNGSLIVEGDIVTGNVSKGWATPSGVYALKYKETNATLKGEDYAVPVGFWMPFNNGIGIHDAVWRTEFGKDIYLKDGSHGCINAPYHVAKAIYENIQSGTPVVCYN